jgi:hypothetical protein
LEVRGWFGVRVRVRLRVSAERACDHALDRLGGRRGRGGHTRCHQLGSPRHAPEGVAVYKLPRMGRLRLAGARRQPAYLTLIRGGGSGA